MQYKAANGFTLPVKADVALKTNMKIRLNFVVVDAQSALSILKQYFHTLEAQLQDATHIDNSVMISALRSNPDLDDADRQDLIQTHYEYYEKEFPKMLRYSFVILLYLVFEKYLKATCHELGKRRGLNLDLNSRRPPNLVTQARNKLEKDALIQVETPELWARVDELRRIRNCVVHANGVLAQVEPERDRQWLDSYVTWDRGVCLDSWKEISVGHGFCETMLGAIDQFFTEVFSACGWELGV